MPPAGVLATLVQPLVFTKIKEQENTHESTQETNLQQKQPKETKYKVPVTSKMECVSREKNVPGRQGGHQQSPYTGRAGKVSLPGGRGMSLGGVC